MYICECFDYCSVHDYILITNQTLKIKLKLKIIYYKYKEVYTDGHELVLHYLQNITALPLDRLALNQNNAFVLVVNAMNGFLNAWPE